MCLNIRKTVEYINCETEEEDFSVMKMFIFKSTSISTHIYNTLTIYSL